MARSVLLLKDRPSGRVCSGRVDARFEVGHGKEHGGIIVLASCDDMFSAMGTDCFVDPADTIRDRLPLGHATEQGADQRDHRGRPDAIRKRWLNSEVLPQ